ncbi:hypothetical protein BC940DRAFT_319286 [Gongronella butleri]|nr:hypothetical protein BC940DRAFT_319286 [Gongronella butleri]
MAALSNGFFEGAFDLVESALQTFSRAMHCRAFPISQKTSKTAYCTLAVWPLLQTPCTMRIGKYELLVATNSLDDKYLADAAFLAEVSGQEFEVLILEASGGTLGKQDTDRDAYDLAKGAYGCHAMIKEMLPAFPMPDPCLLSEVRALFVHTSLRDHKIRLWQVSPSSNGSLLYYELVATTTADFLSTESDKMLELLKFLWTIKTSAERAIRGIASLRASHNARALLEEHAQDTPLALLLQPQPLKP